MDDVNKFLFELIEKIKEVVFNPIDEIQEEHKDEERLILNDEKYFINSRL
jgi:uncharacterized protein YfeS